MADLRRVEPVGTTVCSLGIHLQVGIEALHPHGMGEAAQYRQLIHVAPAHQADAALFAGGRLMPIRKFGCVESMPASDREPSGVRRNRNVQEANVRRLEWEQGKS